MSASHCPICYTELLVKKVTPCMDCGADDFELDHYKQHKYVEYEAYFGVRITLCDYCITDFGSINPTHLGFSEVTSIGMEDFSFVKEIQSKELVLDKYCPNCYHRLPFLNFIIKCRKENK